MISTPVALLVLLAALMHAGWNYLAKAGDDGLLETAGIALGSALIALALLPALPLPDPASWPWLGLTLLIHVAYFAALVMAYRHADLSLAYPLMRGLAPLLVALAAPLAGDPLPPGLLAGVLLVAAGIVLPAAVGLRRKAVSGPGMAFAVANAVLIAAYTLSDGIGVRLSGNAPAYAAWLFALNAWSIVGIAFARRGRATVAYLRRRWPVALGGGALSIGSYGIALWAMSVASIPAVAALRETSVIFAALLGHRLLGEGMGRWRVGGALLVAGGAGLIRFA